MNTNASASGIAPIYAVDLAKNVFQVHVFTAYGERLKQCRWKRAKYNDFFTHAHTRRGLVVMEACASAHYWGRRLVALGYQVKLVPARFVAQHRIGNKNDGRDADAIFVTHRDRRVQAVPVKSLGQQDECAWHRVRERLVDQRTAIVNQLRGLLAERGVVAAKGSAGVGVLLNGLPADHAEVTASMRTLIALLREQYTQVNESIDQVERQLALHLATSPVAQHLVSIFGVGLITATAFAAETGGRVERYADARQFAASFGLSPREHSSGDTRRLGPITKHGNGYLRRLLVQCAQTVVNHRNRRDDPLARLARRLLAQHKRRNVVIVAVANHLARIIYALIKHRCDYRTDGHRHRLMAA